MGVSVSDGVEKSFYFAFITTGVAAGLTYYILVRIWPQANHELNKDLRFREWSADEVEEYAAGSVTRPGRVVATIPPLERAESDDEKKLDSGVVTNILQV